VSFFKTLHKKELPSQGETEAALLFDSSEQNLSRFLNGRQKERSICQGGEEHSTAQVGSLSTAQTKQTETRLEIPLCQKQFFISQPW